MEIPLHAAVDCTDGIYGRSVFVLINPILKEVTHLVVQATSARHTENNLPLTLLSAKIGNTIHVNCSKAEL